MGPQPAVADVRRAVRTALAGSEVRLAGRVLVACSGGSDSLALAAATIFEAPRAGLSAGLVTVDHSLWPGSLEQARAVASIGYELGFDPVEVVRVAVGTAGGPEAAARAARYVALDAAAGALGATVLLGHTLDDQAETVLLGLGRGSGPRSLAGMRPVDGRYRRPFLGLRRATTAAACQALGLTPWDDPANGDARFQRVGLRTQVLPLLEQVLQGGVAEALARTAALTQSDLDALDAMAESYLPAAGADLLASELADRPQAIRTRVLRCWLNRAGVPALTAVHLAELDALVARWHGQARVDLPGGFGVTRVSGRLCLVSPHTHKG
jgi:tRNA(Ile)-lysidine synthase